MAPPTTPPVQLGTIPKFEAPLPSSENQALIQAMETYLTPDEVELGTDGPDGTKVRLLVVPRGQTIHSMKRYLDEYRTAPERKRGTARLTTLESFCAHVARFKDAGSALFADDSPRAPSIVAVLDYNEPGVGSPRFGEHRAVYAFPVSDEWKVWTGAPGMTQAQFAEFIEDHISDVLDPKEAGDSVWKLAEQLESVLATPSQLMTLSKGLAVNVDMRVKNTLNLSTGEQQLSYEEEHKDSTGSIIKVPKSFAVGIPVFTGGTRYKLAIRLRYRVSNGRVTWQLLPHRADVVFRDAITKTCDAAAQSTGLPLFYGTPEDGDDEAEED